MSYGEMSEVMNAQELQLELEQAKTSIAQLKHSNVCKRTKNTHEHKKTH